MKIDSDSRFSKWISIDNIECLSDEYSSNSTEGSGYLENYETVVKDDLTVEAIMKTTIRLIPVRTVNWNSSEDKIRCSLNWQDVQVGEQTEAEDIIEDLIDQTSVKETMDWVYKLFLENTSNTLLLCTLMHALSHLEYERIYPQGPMMAMAMFSFDDKRIISKAIKAFSNWNSKHSLQYISHCQLKDTWARRELNRVIEYIKDNGDDLNVVYNEENHARKVDTRTA